MKVLTLYQPFATLVIIGAKKIETRGWETSHRGILGIHAAAKTPKWCQELILQEPFFSDLPEGSLPTGCILGTAQITYVGSAASLLTEYRGQYPTLARIEECYGDFSPGRSGWLFGKAIPFDTPIPAKGRQRIWNWEPEFKEMYGSR